VRDLSKSSFLASGSWWDDRVNAVGGGV
jgi:hypothetical protein